MYDTSVDSSMDAMMDQAVFGRRVEQFLQSELGRYLVANAEERVEAATAELKRVHPWRTRRIRHLQNEIALWESFQSRLGEAVMAGVQATEALDGR